jgi:SAM-dependent methyltransferase
VRTTHERQYHKEKRDHGPFDLHQCGDCESAFTFPEPSGLQLQSLYGSFRDGLPDSLRQIRSDSSIDAWYRQCLRKLVRISGFDPEDRFTWLDVGAGGGEVAALLSRHFPYSSGVAVDFHTRPNQLMDCANVAWKSGDLNDPDFDRVIGGEFDLVYSISVLEHVIRPERFVTSLMRAMTDGAGLYLVAPNNRSFAKRILGSRWPYFLPGEHITIPSPDACRILLGRVADRLGLSHLRAAVWAHAIPACYPLRYMCRFLGVPFVSAVIPKGAYLPFPTGALDTGIQRRTGA